MSPTLRQKIKKEDDGFKRMNSESVQQSNVKVEHGEYGSTERAAEIMTPVQELSASVQVKKINQLSSI